MANKLGINKPRPADLASISVYPSLRDRSVSRPNNLRRYSSTQREPASRQLAQPQSQLSQSHLYSASSQSQHSFSQGAIFSQPFSQLSQDDPATAFEEWRCNREGRPLSSIPQAARPSETFWLEDSSKKLPLSKTSSLIQKLDSRRMNSHASEDLEKRFEILDEGLSKVISMLDSVQGDVQKLSKAVQSASLESEGIKQKMILQESSLQLLLKEEEKVKTILTTSLNKLCEQKTDAGTLEHLFNELHSIPAAMTRHLSMIKTDLFTCIRNELQTVRECIKFRRDEWAPAETLPYANLDIAKVAAEKGRRPASKKKTTPRVPTARKKQSRKPTPATKEPPRKPSIKQQITSGTAANSKQGYNWTPLSWKEKGTLDEGAPPVTRTVGSRKRGRQIASKKGPAAEKVQTSDAILASTVPTTFSSGLPSIPRAEDNSALAQKKSRRALETTPARASDFNKNVIMNAKVEKNFMDNFTFEMEEEGESFFVPEDTSSKTEHVMGRPYDPHVEDEAQEIRKKIMKARRKRGRSTFVSLCN